MKPTASRQGDERATSQEAMLLDYAERLGRYRHDRRAIHIHLSQLQPYNRRDHHLRIAVKTVDGIVSLFEGQNFLLRSGDIVFICRGATQGAIDEAVQRVRYLFEHDPLVSGLAGDDPERFATSYDLDGDYERFLRTVNTLFDDEMRRQQRHPAGPGPEAGDGTRQALDGHRVGELVEAITRADLSNVMRRQSVCMIIADAAPKPIFRELFISIPDLRDAVMPTHDIAADRWLFQYLTRTLDRRMLSLLRKNDDSAISSAFSINLNVLSILSPEFLAFDTELRTTARGTIVLELQYPDIIADLDAFFFARDFARGRGYRLCLDGVTDTMLPFVDRERLGVEFVKVVWGARLHEAIVAGKQEACREAVDRFGRARTILCRCDDDEAIRCGQSIGVAMFQGRGVDRRLGLAAAPRQPAAAVAR
jgi:hypothetical protein